MRILVTGGCGFVGRRFIHHFLQKDDDEILCVDNLVSGVPPDKWMFQPRHIERLTFRPTDCRSMFRNSGFKPDEFDLVIHCAAIVGGKLNMENDPLAVATNLSLDSELFNWVVRGKYLPRVIYFSSSAIYPTELQTREKNCALAEALVTFDGNRVSLPEGSYGFGKLAGEYLAKIAREKYGLKVAVYRPFGGYGEDQDPETYPFPAIIRRALRGEDPVVIWGSGNQRRDFIHIEDVVDCVLQTMRRDDFTALNIGTGYGISFYELADAVREVTGAKFNIRSDPAKPEGVFARVADPYLMNLAFKHRIILHVGIRKVVKAMQQVLDKETAVA